MIYVTRKPRPEPSLLQKGEAVTLRELKAKDKQWWKARRVEQKVNGIRAVYFKGEFYSYNNKILYNLEPLAQKLKHYQHFVFDGELFQNSWEETVSIARSSKTVKSLQGMQFFTFDCLPVQEFLDGISTQPLHDRQANLSRIVAYIKSEGTRNNVVGLMPYARVTTYDEYYSYLQKILQAGHEGTMIKELEAPYYYHRSKTWLKYKPTKSEDCTIVDVIEGKGRLKKMMGALEVKTPEGVSFHVGTGFDDIERKAAWLDRYDLIGKTVEIKYQYKTPAGKLYAPRFLRWREDKDD